MGIGVSILLIAVGAVLAFAVHVTSNGIDLNTIGIILMIVGGVGLLTSLVIFGPRRRVVQDRVYPDGHVHGGAVTHEHVEY